MRRMVLLKKSMKRIESKVMIMTTWHKVMVVCKNDSSPTGPYQMKT